MLTRCAALVILLVAVSFSTPVHAEEAENASGRKVIVPTAGSVTPSAGEYFYDPAGNITAIGASSYVYDPMSRVVTAAVDRMGTVQSHTYTYDIYGNRTSDGVTSYTASLSTNRLTTQGAQYDAAGNLTQWQPPYTSTPRIYSYDALNTMMMEKVAVAGGEEYIAHIYTADDERYWSFRGGASGLGISRYWLRDLGGQVLREFSEPTPNDWSARDYIYREGLLLASHDTRTEDTHHYSLDHLGTPRVVTNQDAEKVAEHTYFPFGAEYTDGSATDGRLHFTGHEQRDADLLDENRGELDYMHARYYSATLGRFATVDPIWGDIGNPQTFNRYSYVINTPTNLIDPFGLQGMNVTLGASGDWFKTQDEVIIKMQLFSGGSGFSGGGGGFGGGGAGGAFRGRPSSGGGVRTQTATAGSSFLSLKNPVTGLTVGEHWRASGEGLLAFGDGLVPFADPLENWYGAGFVDGLQYSKGAGKITQEVAWAAYGGQVIKRLSLFQNSRLFAKTTGVLNRNDYLRVGWSWRGSRKAGEPVFRVVAGGREHLRWVPAWLRHMDFW